MIDTSSFEVLDKMSTQSFVFTIEQIDSKTLVCGQYQGFIDIIQFSIDNQELTKLIQMRPFQANIYKIVQTEQPLSFAFGCGNGLFFGTYDIRNQQLVLS